MSALRDDVGGGRAVTRPLAKQGFGLSYEDNAAHLSDELHKLDMLIQRRAMASNRRHRMSEGLAAAKGVFISHDEFDELLRDAAPDEASTAAASDVQDRLTAFEDAIDASVKGSVERGVFLGLPGLATRFDLSPLERQAVLVCLAPELDRKYDALYAYLQQDITRKKPSVDLVLDLVCRSDLERWQARPVFFDQGALFRTGILETVDDPRSPSGSSGLARFIKLNDRILGFLLGNGEVDAQLDGLAKVIQPTRSLEEVLIEPLIKTEVEAIVAHHLSGDASEWDRLIVGLHGPRGIGKRDLALGLCDRLGCSLLYVDVALVAVRTKDLASILRLACREGLLQQGALYLDHLDRLPEEDPQASAWLKTSRSCDR